MKLHLHPEPELEFARGRHICPRAGIATWDVYDSRMAVRRDRILVGSVGTSEGLEQLDAWLTRCSSPMVGKIGARQPNLFPSFCGFNAHAGFRATLRHEPEIQRRITNATVRRLLSVDAHADRVREAVEVYFDHVKFLAQNRVTDVVICVIPDDLYDVISVRTRALVEDPVDAADEPVDLEWNFRRALKARCLHLGVPLQLVRAASLSASPRGLQDDATRAWNFSTALYYKANKTVPWRLPAEPSRPPVCFAGIGFYRSRDREVVSTSLAQIFNELGNGVILRGTPVDVSKEDRRPYLSPDQANDLLRRALAEYRTALEHAPARLVVHRTSRFRPEELDAFRAAAHDAGVSTVDFLTIGDTDLRLFRKGLYPPARGSRLEIAPDDHLLYTRGSVPFYGTYPGMYVPQPLRIGIPEAEESPSALCAEVLALTKLNWNLTQFDGKHPITLQCARKVGDVLKYLPPEERPPISYGFYM